MFNKKRAAIAVSVIFYSAFSFVGLASAQEQQEVCTNQGGIVICQPFISQPFDGVPGEQPSGPDAGPPSQFPPDFEPPEPEASLDLSDFTRSQVGSLGSTDSAGETSIDPDEPGIEEEEDKGRFPFVGMGAAVVGVGVIITIFWWWLKRRN